LCKINDVLGPFKYNTCLTLFHVFGETDIQEFGFFQRISVEFEGSAITGIAVLGSKEDHRLGNKSLVCCSACDFLFVVVNIVNKAEISYCMTRFIC
jgi:hypothetical protein